MLRACPSSNPWSTLAPEDEGFDPAKAPKVTLYGTGNYCGKAEHYFTISENTAAAPTITTSSLPDGKVGEAYSQTLTADGTTPITWNIIGGTLPESLTLNETTGKISGTPTAAGTASFTAKAENSAGSDTKELSITITKAAPAEFTISVKTDGNGTASASLAKAAANTEITLSATPNEGYRFKEWQVMRGNVTIKDDKFTMPDSDVEIKAIFEEGAPAEYTVRFNANGGGGTMADVTGVSGSYTLPSCGFTEPEGKQFKGWSTSADGSVISGTTYEVSSDTTFYAIWESKEYSIIVTDGKATIGAGSEISKAAQGTTITLTANAAPDGKVFDKWVVESGNTTLEDANSETTTFIMPDSEVSVKATSQFPILIPTIRKFRSRKPSSRLPTAPTMQYISRAAPAERSAQQKPLQQQVHSSGTHGQAIGARTQTIIGKNALAATKRRTRRLTITVAITSATPADMTRPYRIRTI